jgi:hypothetical protein
MRLRRSRVLFFVGAVALAFLGVFAMRMEYWIGSTRTDLRIRVVDADTGRPVPNASVRVFEYEESASEGKTHPDGWVTLTHWFSSAGENGLFRKTGGLRLWVEKLSVEAEGYEPLRGPLDDFTGPNRNLRDLPLPPVTVELRRRRPVR